MTFRDFLEDSLCISEIHFYVQEQTYEPYEVLIEDIGMLNFIIPKLQNLAKQVFIKDVPKETLKKFKVSMRYPRTKKGAELGHYLPDNLYVFARNAQEARQKAIDSVKNKLEPIENQEKKFPKVNYVKNLKLKDMDVKTKEAKTWQDFTDSLSAMKSSSYLHDHYDEEDLKLIIQRAKSPKFIEDLKSLDSHQQKMLKKVYFTLAQDPYQEIKPDISLDKTIKKVGSKDIPALPKEDEVERSKYWSIFEPKNDEEEAELWSKMETAQDVLETAKRFGIPPNHVKKEVENQIHDDRSTFKEKTRLYRDAWKHVKTEAKKKNIDLKNIDNVLKNGDYVTLERLVGWDTMVEEMIGSYSQEAFPFYLHSDHGNDGYSLEVYKKASDYLMDLMRYGVPKVDSLFDYYKQALGKMLQDRRSGNNVPF